MEIVSLFSFKFFHFIISMELVKKLFRKIRHMVENSFEVRFDGKSDSLISCNIRMLVDYFKVGTF